MLATKKLVLFCYSIDCARQKWRLLWRNLSLHIHSWQPSLATRKFTAHASKIWFHVKTQISKIKCKILRLERKPTASFLFQSSKKQNKTKKHHKPPVKGIVSLTANSAEHAISQRDEIELVTCIGSSSSWIAISVCSSFYWERDTQFKISQTMNFQFPLLHSSTKDKSTVFFISFPRLQRATIRIHATSPSLHLLSCLPGKHTSSLFTVISVVGEDKKPTWATPQWE